MSYANIDVGSYSKPQFIDIDSDKDPDLFVGNGKGRIIFYLNYGNAKNPRFVLKSTRFAKMLVKRNASPAFFHWNEDKNPDLLLGGKSGLLTLASFHPLPNYSVTYGWQHEQTGWDDIQAISYSAPFLMDLNQDKKEDLLLGDLQGNILLWLNRGFKKPEELPEEEIILAQNALMQQEEILDSDLPATETSTEAYDSEDIEIEPEPEENDLPIEPVFLLVNKKYGNFNLKT